MVFLFIVVVSRHCYLCMMKLKYVNFFDLNYFYIHVYAYMYASMYVLYCIRCV